MNEQVGLWGGMWSVTNTLAGAAEWCAVVRLGQQCRLRGAGQGAMTPVRTDFWGCWVTAAAIPAGCPFQLGGVRGSRAVSVLSQWWEVWWVRGARPRAPRGVGAMCAWEPRRSLRVY